MIMHTRLTRPPSQQQFTCQTRALYDFESTLGCTTNLPVNTYKLPTVTIVNNGATTVTPITASGDGINAYGVQLRYNAASFHLNRGIKRDSRAHIGPVIIIGLERRRSRRHRSRLRRRRPGHLSHYSLPLLPGTVSAETATTELSGPTADGAGPNATTTAALPGSTARVPKFYAAPALSRPTTDGT
ncbi:hypothetical protein PG993_011475 [Apiospora rasikravindrae]|uniref:Uncharacterized protein n=1 Tax=Apiospora rasikravindrae TaxID=990691 RepID=A0ABR1SEC8_9PEZI